MDKTDVKVDEITRTPNLTLFRGRSEVMVFGDGVDWIVRYTSTTSPKDSWRKWFGGRDLAETFAKDTASKPYLGRFN